MSDKELLELAAKAAGITIEFKRCAESMDDYELKGECGPFIGNVGWNPLTNDGDALRLAVKLGMCADFRHDQSWAAFTQDPDSSIGEYMGAAEYHRDDPYAATRRAIVRAAAEIGKAMP